MASPWCRWGHWGLEQAQAIARDPLRLPGPRAAPSPASDIDLTLIGPAISAAALARIEADLDDLLLSWMIDLSWLASIHHPDLLAHIERAGVLLYRCADAPD
jgi:hypothetical protein